MFTNKGKLFKYLSFIIFHGFIFRNTAAYDMSYLLISVLSGILLICMNDKYNANKFEKYVFLFPVKSKPSNI